MKRMLFVLLAAVSLSGCASEVSEVREEKTKTLYLKNSMDSYSIRKFEYDGHEYVAFGQGNSLSVVHDPNCKFCKPAEKGIALDRD